MTFRFWVGIHSCMAVSTNRKKYHNHIFNETEKSSPGPKRPLLINNDGWLVRGNTISHRQYIIFYYWTACSTSDMAKSWGTRWMENFICHRTQKRASVQCTKTNVENSAHSNSTRFVHAVVDGKTHVVCIVLRASVFRNGHSTGDMLWATKRYSG